MKAEKALVGAFSVITNLRMELFELHLSRDWGHLTEDSEDGGREEAAQPRAAQEAVVQDQGEVVRGAAGEEEAEAGEDTPGHHHA